MPGIEVGLGAGAQRDVAGNESLRGGTHSTLAGGDPERGAQGD
ncbi:hypothetical protein ACIQZB_40850 [Streptomyces sp. NPDC097727]